MVQRRKPEIREAIVAAAAGVFAQVGYEGATLAGIAARAGSSVGNVYKYFRDKEELFAAAIPASLAAELRAALMSRVEALGAARDVRALPADHPYRAASARLLGLVVRHRAAAVFLLCRAGGTAHAGFAERVAGDLARGALRYAMQAYDGLRLDAPARRTLARIYRGFVAGLASILEEERSTAALELASEQLARYHLAGVRSFLEAQAAQAEAS